MPVKKLFYVLMFFCQIFIFIFLLALSLYKIGCALELATLKTLFSICLFAQLALSLHFIMP